MADLAAMGDGWLAWLLVGAWLVVGTVAARLDARGRWILGVVLAGLGQLAVVTGIAIALRAAAMGEGLPALGPVAAVLTTLLARRCLASRDLPQLAVRDWGRGAPVVFLHGAGGSSRYWRRVARADAKVAVHELGRLGPLAALTIHGRRLGWALCQVMCTFRPLATILVPLVVRDVSPSIAADSTRHTWVSYRRTVRSVVVEHRVADDLRHLHVRTRILHGVDDRVAPLEHLQVAIRDVPGVDVRVVPGDHHLALRSPELVAGHLAELLAAQPPLGKLRV